MFTSQVQGMLSQLAGFMPQPAIDAMIQVFGNCAQQIDHRGPVNINTYGQQPSLELNNGMPNQTVFQIDNGNVIIGPKGATPPGTGGNVTINDPLTVNGISTFNNQAYFYDDITFADADLVFKYCNAGFGSTIARIKLLGPMVAGQAAAQVIDCNGNAVSSNVSGQQGSGKITVHDCSQSTYQCAVSGQCGYAIYMSDCNPNGGSAVDCIQRPNGGHWEVIKLNMGSLSGVCSVDVVDKVCCLNGQIVACKKTLQFTEPVKVTTPACACP